MSGLLETCPVLKDDRIRKLPALLTKRWGPAGAQNSRAEGNCLGGGSPSQVSEWSQLHYVLPCDLEESLHLSGFQILTWDETAPSTHKVT